MSDGIRLVHDQHTVALLRGAVVASWAGDLALFVASRTALAVLLAVPYGRAVDVHLSEAAARLVRPVLGLTEEASEERALERRDRATVRESRDFRFPG